MNRLHWTLTITAFALAVLGVTPYGSAAVTNGVSAGKAPLYAAGILQRGPRGRRGPRGFRGPKGAPGDPGASGPAGAEVLARARATAPVAASGGAGADVPLTGNTWSQAAGEDEIVFGTVTLQAPAACNAGMDYFSVPIYLDGSLVSSFSAYSPPSGTTTFVLPLAFAPAADTSHTLVAKAQESCTSGSHYTVTDLKLDVLGIA
jgi:hypothetical protein